MRKQKDWSSQVTQESDSLDIEKGVFTWADPRNIARSLKRSAEASKRRRGTPFKSAMSMLNFYVNRAGKNLSTSRKRILEKTKQELRKLFRRLS
tara:strand:+ start:218 stop:499 length:282 start_codon:yes stop_codon:yes gene_type:complete